MRLMVLYTCAFKRLKLKPCMQSATQVVTNRKGRDELTSCSCRPWRSPPSATRRDAAGRRRLAIQPVGRQISVAAASGVGSDGGRRRRRGGRRRGRTARGPPDTYLLVFWTRPSPHSTTAIPCPPCPSPRPHERRCSPSPATSRRPPPTRSAGWNLR